MLYLLLIISLVMPLINAAAAPEEFRTSLMTTDQSSTLLQIKQNLYTQFVHILKCHELSVNNDLTLIINEYTQEHKLAEDASLNETIRYYNTLTLHAQNKLLHHHFGAILSRINLVTELNRLKELIDMQTNDDASCNECIKILDLAYTKIERIAKRTRYTHKLLLAYVIRTTMGLDTDFLTYCVEQNADTKILQSDKFFYDVSTNRMIHQLLVLPDSVRVRTLILELVNCQMYHNRSLQDVVNHPTIQSLINEKQLTNFHDGLKLDSNVDNLLLSREIAKLKVTKQHKADISKIYPIKQFVMLYLHDDKFNRDIINTFYILVMSYKDHPLNPWGSLSSFIPWIIDLIKNNKGLEAIKRFNDGKEHPDKNLTTLKIYLEKIFISELLSYLDRYKYLAITINDYDTINTFINLINNKKFSRAMQYIEGMKNINTNSIYNHTTEYATQALKLLLHEASSSTLFIDCINANMPINNLYDIINKLEYNVISDHLLSDFLEIYPHATFSPRSKVYLETILEYLMVHPTYQPAFLMKYKSHEFVASLLKAGKIKTKNKRFRLSSAQRKILLDRLDDLNLTNIKTDESIMRQQVSDQEKLERNIITQQPEQHSLKPTGFAVRDVRSHAKKRLSAQAAAPQTPRDDKTYEALHEQQLLTINRFFTEETERRGIIESNENEEASILQNFEKSERTLRQRNTGESRTRDDRPASGATEYFSIMSDTLNRSYQRPGEPIAVITPAKRRATPSDPRYYDETTGSVVPLPVASSHNEVNQEEERGSAIDRIIQQLAPDGRSSRKSLEELPQRSNTRKSLADRFLEKNSRSNTPSAPAAAPRIDFFDTLDQPPTPPAM